MSETLEAIVARLDERTKNIYEILKDHCDTPSCETCKLTEEVGRLQTNVSWVKRIGAAVIVVFSTALGLRGF